MKIVSSVLLVDDSLRDLALSSIVLTQSGRYPRITKLRTGEQALTRLSEGPKTPTRDSPLPLASGLVLLDINMPAMNGFEMLDALYAARHALPPLPPIVMLSSSSRPEDRARTDRYADVYDYIVKPLQLEDAVALAERFGDVVVPPKEANR